MFICTDDFISNLERETEKIKIKSDSKLTFDKEQCYIAYDLCLSIDGKVWLNRFKNKLKTIHPKLSVADHSINALQGSKITPLRKFIEVRLNIISILQLYWLVILIPDILY